jgi:hypothetical protein
MPVVPSYGVMRATYSAATCSVHNPLGTVEARRAGTATFLAAQRLWSSFLMGMNQRR